MEHEIFLAVNASVRISGIGIFVICGVLFASGDYGFATGIMVYETSIANEVLFGL
jgi:hypothetical protein